MPEKEWMIKLQEGEHKITLKHGALIRKYYVNLDGNIIKSLKRTVIENGDKLIFNINSHTCVLLIYFIKGGVKYECVIDDTSIETQMKSEIPPEWKPPKQGCLKQILMQVSVLLGWAIVIGIISGLTGFNSDKIELIIVLIVVAFIIYGVLRHFLQRIQ